MEWVKRNRKAVTVIAVMFALVLGGQSDAGDAALQMLLTMLGG